MENNVKFKEKSYWDERFEKECEYEWFGITFSDLLPFLKKDLPAFEGSGEVKMVLMLGTGNSMLPVEMAADDSGQYIVFGSDYSEVVLQSMKQRSRDEVGQLEWLTCDIRAMPIRPGSFDIVFEKGTLDVFFVGEKDPWNISKETTETVNRVIRKAWEVLRTDGIFLSITFAQPHFRLPFFYQTGLDWSVTWFPVRGKSSEFEYFAYAAVKSRRKDKDDKSPQMIDSVWRLLQRASLENGAERMRLSEDDDTEALYLTQRLGDFLF